MIDVAYDNREMTDAYLLFRKRDDIDKWIAHETDPVARFRACDYVDFNTDNMVTSGVSRKDLQHLTIKTYAILNFCNDDWIYDIKSKVIWRVESTTMADDGQMKELSLRPRKATFLKLIRR
ncbi:MAG: hypothetical protein NC087_04405 [Anaeroplasma bactoclasticum]|nr:hypothetical protein [Anaeroplasma bactoclasticum]